MINIPASLLNGNSQKRQSLDLRFACWPDEDVYNALMSQQLGGMTSPGSLHFVQGDERLSIEAIGKPDDAVRVVAARDADEAGVKQVKGYVRKEGIWRETPVECLPVETTLHSRLQGVLETDVLAECSVSIVGCGSIGAPTAIELAKAGVGHFDLMDHDRLEVANVARHPAGLSHVGRFKTHFLADAIMEKNPNARVRTCETKVTWESEGVLRELVRRSAMSICTTDNRPSRVIHNKVSVEEGKPVLLPGAFRRAYGGQILWVRPGETPCYECFLRALPRQSRDQEVSSAEEAARIAYSDRPIPVEPGLSAHIAPLSLMVVTLAIQYLLNGKATTLESLNDDLVASLFLWLNRREAGTDYEHLEPLEFNVDGIHVLRWYGVDFKRDPRCPCCGDSPAHAAVVQGVDAGAQSWSVGESAGG